MKQSIDLRIVFGTIVLFMFLTAVIVGYQLKLPVDHPHKKKKFKKLKNRLKTGDLLAVSYTNIYGKLVKIFTGSVWTHLGMVVWRDGKCYVLEMARYHRYESGLIHKPLEEWINWNKRYVLAYRPYVGINEFPISKMAPFLNMALGMDLEPDMSVVSWMQTLVTLDYRKHDNKNKYFCSEFIVHALQTIGVLKKVTKASSYKPWQLLYGKIPTHRGYDYGQASLVTLES